MSLYYFLGKLSTFVVLWSFMVYLFRPCIFCKEITILHRKSVPKLIYMIHILTVFLCAKDQVTGLNDFAKWVTEAVAILV